MEGAGEGVGEGDIGVGSRGDGEGGVPSGTTERAVRVMAGACVSQGISDGSPMRW